MEEQNSKNSGCEKVLESRVISESVRKTSDKENKEQKNKNGINARSALVLCLGTAVLGYGIANFRAGYEGQQFSEAVVREFSINASNQGYSKIIWDSFPADTRYSLITEDLTNMPYTDSWKIIKPAIRKKISGDIDSFRYDIDSLYKDIVGSDGQQESKNETSSSYKLIKQFFNSIRRK